MVTTRRIGFAVVAQVPFGVNIAKAKMRAVTEVTISCYNDVEN